MNNVFITILSAIAIPLLLFLLIWFIIRFKKYKYVGNLYIGIAIIFAVCYVYSLYLRLYPYPSDPMQITVDGTTDYSVVVHGDKDSVGGIIFGSFFDAAKMFALAGDTSKYAPFFKFSKELGFQYFYNLLFGIGYVLASISGLLSVSALVVLIYLRNFTIRVNTIKRSVCRKKKIFYIFADPQVTIAARLADAVTRDGDIAIFYLSRASQKTQDGSEYREMLIGKGFDVRVETYGLGLCRWLFNKHFRRNRFYGRLGWRQREVHVFGLFSEDTVANELGENFKDAVMLNKPFVKAKRKIVYESDKKAVEKIIKTIDEYSNETDELKREEALMKLANKISPLIGLEKVVDMSNKRIKDTIKKDILHDGDFGLLCAKLRMDAHEAIKPTPEKIKYWINRLNKLQKSRDIKDYKLDAIENFRVFITYHDGDMDLSHNNSATTLHIVNTLSEYDMISTEFVLNNQISNFLKIEPNMEIKEGEDNKHMHVSFFGFGRINRPIFEKMTCAYQLWGDNVNRVHYHILDMAAMSFFETIENQYTKRKEVYKEFDPPLLYEFSVEEDGKDLTSYEVIDEHIKKAFDDPNRFKEDGFEIFVVSVVNSATSIQVANCLRRAIVKHNKERPDKSILRAAIFVKVSNQSMVDGFYGNKQFVKNQEYINDEKLLKDDRKEEELVPIVIFGQNTFMSKYVDDYYKLIDKVGKSSEKTYNGDKMDLIRRKWLLKDKNGVLSNTTSVYTLKPKLKLVNYKLSQDPFTNVYFIEPNEGAQPIENIFRSNDNERIIQELEHNRWMASEYLIHQYDQHDIYTFINSIHMEDGEISYDTKDRDKTKHVCMLSNKDLQTLNSMMKQKKDVDENKLKRAADKLTYYNDVDTIKAILGDLKKN